MNKHPNEDGKRDPHGPGRGRRISSGEKRVREQAGHGIAHMANVQARFPGSARKQLIFFDEFSMVAATGRHRVNSLKTVKKIKGHMSSFLTDLITLNMRVSDLPQINKKHALAVLKLAAQRGQAPKTIVGKATSFRRFLTWMGKPDAVPPLAEIFDDPAIYACRSSSIESKNWETLGVRPHLVVKLLEPVDYPASLQMKAQMEFGLRVEESLMLRPLEADLGTELSLTDGTKGGRPRSVPITNPNQRELLERMKEVARGNKRGLVSSKPKKTLEQNRRRFYHLCEKAGVTKKCLGVTPHGLRHLFVSNSYERRTGQKMPVDGGEPVSKETDRQARKEGAIEVGHSRPSIMSQYGGHLPNLEKYLRLAMQNLLDSLQDDLEMRTMVSALPLASLYIVGPAAQGRPYPGGIQLAYVAMRAPGQEQSHADAALYAAAACIAQRAAEILSCPCTCVPLQAFGAQHVDSLELSRLTAQPPSDRHD